MQLRSDFDALIPLKPEGEAGPLRVISGHQGADRGCPLHPQEQTCSSSASMSAKCH